LPRLAHQPLFDRDGADRAGVNLGGASSSTQAVRVKPDEAKTKAKGKLAKRRQRHESTSFWKKGPVTPQGDRSRVSIR
jgi:hypothetical protein